LLKQVDLTSGGFEPSFEYFGASTGLGIEGTALQQSACLDADRTIEDLSYRIRDLKKNPSRWKYARDAARD
jgi:hypothetical protein